MLFWTNRLRSSINPKIRLFLYCITVTYCQVLFYFLLGVFDMKHQKHSRHEGGGHAHHIKEFKRKFFVCLVLTIPVLLLSEMIQSWFGFTISIPLQKEVLFFLSLIVYLYGGLPFLRGMYQELKKRQPGMMTLIGTAISVAFFYLSLIHIWRCRRRG